jgi:F-type H+-transporting ATPase subunit gamma
MGNLRDIKNRIKSVKNTGKITRAMQLVAASKMKKAQDTAIAGRPYAQLMAELLNAIQQSLHDEEFHHPLLDERPVKKRGIILISTDKGLCGGLNTNLFRKVIDLGAENARFLTVGRKASQFVTRTRRELLADFTVTDQSRFIEVRPVVEYALKAYLDGEIDTIEIVYTRFINNLKQEPVAVSIVPLVEVKAVLADIKAAKSYSADEPIANDDRGFKFEPSPSIILDQLLSLFVKREIYHMVLEAKASEHSARMVAMKTATDNAKTLVEDLTLQFNKARQAAITQEILEISAATLAAQ